MALALVFTLAPGATAQEEIPFDEVITDDLIVEGSICVHDTGSACVNGESFLSPGGLFAEAKLKDGAPGIWFEDTNGRDWEVLSSFPADDDVFKIRSIETGESTLTPFQIEPDAPNEAFAITSIGVGINDDTPNHPLEIVGSPGNAVVRASHTGPATALRTVFSVANVGPPSFTMIDTSAGGEDWFFRSSGIGNFVITGSTSTSTALQLSPSGNLTIAGSLTQSSSRELKTDIEAVDTAAILDGVNQLDLATWAYNTEPGVTHIGPMAEDFYATFNVGATPTGIAAVDADGVALAAIQALTTQNQALQAQVDALEARLDTLEG